VKRGGEVTIFAAGHAHLSRRDTRVKRGALLTTQTFDGVRFVWLRTFPYRRNDWRRMANMASYAVIVTVASLGRPAPDVVVGSTVHPFAALAGWFVARLRRARFFYEIRDLWPQTLIDLGAMHDSSAGARLLRAIETFLVRRSEIVISVLPGLANYLDEHGLPSDHVQYLPNGVDLAGTVAPERSGGTGRTDTIESLIGDLTRRREAGEVQFIYLGAHGRINRVDVIIEAMHLAKERTSIPVRLLLVGDGPEKPSLLRFASSLGTTNVDFSDPVPKARVPALLGAVDVGVIHLTDIGVFRYGTSPNKLFDYMAAGLPIAFAIRTSSDQVQASGAGLTVPPDDPDALADAIVDLAELTPEQRRGMGSAGRAYLEREHDLGSIGARFADLVGCADGVSQAEHV
jgi:glycosyltransferase involved in cell wall biosynthesis